MIGRALLLLPLGAACAGAVPAAARPPIEAARAYVEHIYRAIPTPGFDYRALRYTPELASWMRRDAAASRRSGDVGVLDAVPFCGCQDNDPNYALIRSMVVPTGKTGAAVTVLLRNGPERRFRIDLAWRAGAWRIADIHGPRSPSLLATLRRDVPAAEATLAADHR